MKMRRLITQVLIPSLLLVQSIWAVEATKIEEKTYPLQPGSAITLLADEGDIVVSSWTKDEVYLKMTKRAWGRSREEAERNLEMLEVQIQDSRDRLVIRQLEIEKHRHFNVFDVFEGEFWNERRWRDHAIDFELKIPQNIKLKLKTDEGDVQVDGMMGELIIEVDEGNIEINDVVSDQSEIQVDEGDVYCTNFKDTGNGIFQVDTDEGNIYFEHVAIRELDLNSDEGDVTLRNVNAEQFWVSSDEGDIEAYFIPAPNGNYKLETEEGNIDLYFLKEPNLFVRLRTNEGRIDTDFDLHIRRNDDAAFAEGILGKEAGILKALTDEGDIYLRKQ